MTPHWLDTLSVYAVAFGICSALFATVDILAGRRQRMAIMNFVWPLTLLWSGPCFFLFLGREIRATNIVFWFLMQIGRAAGFLTSFPVNIWLVKVGIKERMKAPGYPPIPLRNTGDGRHRYSVG